MPYKRFGCTFLKLKHAPFECLEVSAFKFLPLLAFYSVFTCLYLGYFERMPVIKVWSSDRKLKKMCSIDSLESLKAKSIVLFNFQEPIHELMVNKSIGSKYYAIYYVIYHLCKYKHLGCT